MVRSNSPVQLVSLRFGNPQGLLLSSDTVPNLFNNQYPLSVAKLLNFSRDQPFLHITSSLVGSFRQESISKHPAL
jgi:hypothetical protein